MDSVSDFLKSVSFCRDLNDPARSRLAALLVSKKIAAGAVIFRELDDSDCLYIVQRGRIIISKHVQDEVDVVLTRFHSGDFFGEMGLFDTAPRSATAQTETDSILLRLDRKPFQQILVDDPDIAAPICYRLVTVFIERLRATNDQAREAIRWGLEATGFSAVVDRAPFGRKST